MTEKDLQLIILHAERRAERIGLQLKEHLVNKFQSLVRTKPLVPCDKSKWIMNLSSRKLNDVELSILQRGLDFSVTPKNLPITAIISEVENGCSRLPEHEKALIRAKVVRFC